MNISELTDSDIGRWVAYRPKGQPHTTEIGRITDWNPVYVMVRFTGPRPHWDTVAVERTPMWCLPDNLRFIVMRPDGGYDELTKNH